MTPSDSQFRAAARLAAIVESSEDAIISKDLNGVVETWNSAAERVYGYRPEEMIGRPMALLLPDDRKDEETEILSKIGRGERVEHFETKRVRSDGRIIDVSLTISPVRDEDGAIVGASHVARDITEQKRFEARLRQSQRLESLGVLAGGIAHDFNNLLTGIVGTASLMSEMLPPGSELRPLVEESLSAGTRLSELTQQLLAYSGRTTIVLQPFDLSAKVREIAALIRSAVPRNVGIRLELADELPPVSGDPTQIQQVVMNLIINAAEAIDDHNGVVLARTYRQDVDAEYIHTVLAADEIQPGVYICLEVEDNGKGMDAPTQARIFDPFFTTKVKGRGLGLASVLGIVRGHGGALKVYSEPGEGTSVKVLLPGSSQEQHRIGPVPSGDVRGSGTVLLIDDEEVVRKVGRMALERYGYTVLTAPDGLAGLELYEQHAGEIRLVILDMIMPKMGGEQTYARLRQIDPGLPVVVASGYSDRETLARFGKLPVAGFLRKPFTAFEIGRVIKEALNSRQHISGKLPGVPDRID
ncbi:MAG: PAS domain S-box protein [Bryobacteraceae bacterium]